MAPVLLATAAGPSRLIGDKAYDTDAFRTLLAERSIEAVIPSSARRTRACPLDRVAYRRRNLIERMFCRLRTGGGSLECTPFDRTGSWVG